MDSAGHMTCELQVDTQSPGWHKTLMKVLASIKGLSFTIDAEQGIARVSGQIDPGTLLQMLAKAGKHADLLWVDSGNHNVQKMNDNLHNSAPMMMPGNGYGYYTNNMYIPYGSMDYYMEDPQSRHLYSHYQDYPQYYPQYYPYHEPPARYFPQAPPPTKNPRLLSFCNMM